MNCLWSGDSPHRGLVALIEDGPVLAEQTAEESHLDIKLKRCEFVGSDLRYSDGVDPEPQGLFVLTAQEPDVVGLLLDVGMLGNRQ